MSDLLQAEHDQWMAESRDRQAPGGRERAMAKYNAELRAAQAYREERPETVDVLQQMRRLGVPAQALFALRNEKPSTLVEQSLAWWRGDKRVSCALVMLGDVGVGKTVAAAAVVAEWAKDYPWNSLPTGSDQAPCVWLAGTTLARLGLFGEDNEDLVAGAATCHLFVVDDTGGEGDRRALESVTAIVTERVDNHRATILTSNAHGQKFRERYGEPLADRLRACAVVPRSASVTSLRRPQ